MVNNIVIVAFFIFCTGFLITLPGETRQNVILGLSPVRWAMALWLGFQAAAMLIVNRIFSHPKYANDVRTWLRKGQRWSLIFWLSIFILGCCAFFFYENQNLKDEQLQRIFLYLTPSICWIIFCAIYILGLYFTSNWNILSEQGRGFIDQTKGYIRKNYLDIFAFLVLISLTLAIFTPVTINASRVPESDSIAHLNLTHKTEVTRQVFTPHFLYSFLIIGLHTFLPNASLADLGNAVLVLFYVFSASILFFVIRWFIRDDFTEKPTLRSFLACILPLSLLLITPITIFTWQNHNLYFGYIAIQVYHNPTIILLKPFALLLFLAMVKMFQYDGMEKEFRKNIPILLLIGLTIFGILAKPNFVICILPASGVMFVVWLLRRRPVDWIRLIGGVYIPALIPLAWEYITVFTSYHILPVESKVIFAPFAVYGIHSKSLFFPFILSILFPLAVYFGYFQQAKKSFELNFAWLTFIFGTFFTYFIAEGGVTFNHGNFTWCGQITLFVLFVISFLFFVKEGMKNAKSPAAWICVGLFLLHLISGLLWYWVHLYRPMEIWW